MPKTNHNENKESSSIIWLNPDININNRFKNAKKNLHLINDYVIIYSELESCISFIQTISKEKIYLIISGPSTSHMLSRIHSRQQIESIFIFCSNKIEFEYLLIDYPKIIDIYVDIDLLCVSLQEQIQLREKQLQVFEFPNPSQLSIEDLSKKFSSILLLNEIIRNLPQTEQAKSQMINVCREYYRNNLQQQELINEFETSYQSEEAIRWYLNESFICKLVNKALHTFDIEQLYLLRFFHS